MISLMKRDILQGEGKRIENVEKKEVLLRAASLFRNLCPYPVGSRANRE